VVGWDLAGGVGEKWKGKEGREKGRGREVALPP